jgi:acetyl esterase/lipase
LQDCGPHALTLIHVHGGCYVLFPAESGTLEGIIMAGDEHYKVISVDYRMPPKLIFQPLSMTLSRSTRRC